MTSRENASSLISTQQLVTAALWSDDPLIYKWSGDPLSHARSFPKTHSSPTPIYKPDQEANTTFALSHYLISLTCSTCSIFRQRETVLSCLVLSCLVLSCLCVCVCVCVCLLCFLCCSLALLVHDKLMISEFLLLPFRCAYSGYFESVFLHVRLFLQVSSFMCASSLCFCASMAFLYF
jgi:hypothetical protein